MALQGPSLGQLGIGVSFEETLRQIRRLKQQAQRELDGLRLNPGGSGGGGAPRQFTQTDRAIQQLRLSVSGLRSAYQANNATQAQTERGMVELIARMRQLQQSQNLTRRQWQQLQLAQAQATRTLQGLNGQMSRLGIASQVGLSIRQNLLTPLYALGPAGAVAAAALQGIGTSAAGATTGIAALNVALGAGLVGAAIALGVGIIGATRSIVSLEREQANVIKTTGLFKGELIGLNATLNGLETDEITNLTRNLQNVSGSLGSVSTKELLNLAAVAGQLGVRGVSDLTLFTEELAKLQIATDIVGEEGASQLARFINVTKETGQSTGEAAKVVSNVINELGNTLPATSGEILETAKNVAQLSQQADVSQADVLAFSGALKAVGIEAELSGSAITRVFVNVGEAVRGGGQALADYAAVAGQTSEQFRTLFETNQADAVEAFIGGLKRAKESGQDLAPILDQLGINELRLRRVVSSLAGGYDTLNLARRTAADEAERLSSIDDEVANKQDTLAAQTKILFNRFAIGAQVLGEALLPNLRALVDAFLSNESVIGNFTASTVVAVNTIEALVSVSNAIARSIFGVFVGLQQGLTSIIPDVQKVTDAYGLMGEQLQAILSFDFKRIGELRGEMASLRKEILSDGFTVGDFGGEFLAGFNTATAGAYENLQTQIQEALASISNFGSISDAANGKVRVLSEEIQSAADKAAALAGGLLEGESGLEGFGNGAGKAGKNVRTVAKVMAELDKVMRSAPQIAAALGESFDETDVIASHLEKTIKELITDFGFTASDAKILDLIQLLGQYSEDAAKSLDELLSARLEGTQTFTQKLEAYFASNKLPKAEIRQQLVDALQGVGQEIQDFGPLRTPADVKAFFNLQEVKETVKGTLDSLFGEASTEIQTLKFRLDTGDIANADALPILKQMRGELELTRDAALEAQNYVTFREAQGDLQEVEGLLNDVQGEMQSTSQAFAEGKTNVTAWGEAFAGTVQGIRAAREEERELRRQIAAPYVIEAQLEFQTSRILATREPVNIELQNVTVEIPNAVDIGVTAGLEVLGEETSAVAQKMRDDLKTAFTGLEREYAVFGDKNAELTGKISLVENAITSLLANGFNPEGSVIQKLYAQYEELNRAKANSVGATRTQAQAAEDFASAQERLNTLLKEGGSSAEFSQVADDLARAGREAGVAAGAVDEFVASAQNAGSKAQTLERFTGAIDDIQTGLGLASQGFRTFADLVDKDTARVLNALDSIVTGLGGVAGGLAQIATGNIFGGIVSIIGSIFSFIGSLFGQTEEAAKDAEAAIDRMKRAFSSNLDRSYEISLDLADAKNELAVLTGQMTRFEAENQQILLDHGREYSDLIATQAKEISALRQAGASEADIAAVQAAHAQQQEDLKEILRINQQIAEEMAKQARADIRSQAVQGVADAGRDLASARDELAVLRGEISAEVAALKDVDRQLSVDIGSITQAKVDAIAAAKDAGASPGEIAFIAAQYDMQLELTEETAQIQRDIIAEQERERKRAEAERKREAAFQRQRARDAQRGSNARDLASLRIQIAQANGDLTDSAAAAKLAGLELNFALEDLARKQAAAIRELERSGASASEIAKEKAGFEEQEAYLRRRAKLEGELRAAQERERKRAEAAQRREERRAAAERRREQEHQIRMSRLSQNNSNAQTLAQLRLQIAQANGTLSESAAAVKGVNQELGFALKQLAYDRAEAIRQLKASGASRAAINQERARFREQEQFLKKQAYLQKELYAAQEKAQKREEARQRAEERRAERERKREEARQRREEARQRALAAEEFQRETRLLRFQGARANLQRRNLSPARRIQEEAKLAKKEAAITRNFELERLEEERREAIREAPRREYRAINRRYDARRGAIKANYRAERALLEQQRREEIEDLKEQNRQVLETFDEGFQAIFGERLRDRLIGRIDLKIGITADQQKLLEFASQVGSALEGSVGGVGDALKALVEGNRTDALQALRSSLYNSAFEAISSAIVQSTVVKGFFGSALTKATEQIVEGNFAQAGQTLNALGNQLPGFIGKLEGVLGPVLGSLRALKPALEEEEQRSVPTGIGYEAPVLGDATPRWVVKLESVLDRLLRYLERSQSNTSSAYRAAVQEPRYTSFRNVPTTFSDASLGRVDRDSSRLMMDAASLQMKAARQFSADVERFGAHTRSLSYTRNAYAANARTPSSSQT